MTSSSVRWLTELPNVLVSNTGSTFKCYALTTQTFGAISACDITLLSAALNKDCVCSGLTCCLGGEPSGSQVAAIKKSPC